MHKKHNSPNVRCHGLERLEERELLTVAPITLAHPSFYGTSSNGISSDLSMSADGQLVVFESTADDLVPNDFNGQSDVFLFNRSTGEVSLVSVNYQGTASGSNSNLSFQSSQSPMISDDGRFVVFVSGATDLVDGFVPGFGSISNIYLRDLQTQTTVLVSESRDAENQGAAGPSVEPRISNDGSTVLFRSNAPDLLVGINGGNNHLYAWDRETEEIDLITINRDNDGLANSTMATSSREVSLSGTGRFVAFRSNATNLVDLDDNGIDQIYLRDRELQTTTMVTIDFFGGIGGNGHSFVSHQAISDDGRYVVFYGGDRNLVDAPLFGAAAFVRDMQEGVTSFVSVHEDGIQGRHGFAPVITPDGRRVAFTSLSDDLVTEDANARSDVFVRDLTTNETILVSVNAAGTGSGAEPGFIFNHAIPPAISPNGRYVAFQSTATNLVAGLTDQESTIDVFLRDLETNTTRGASVSLAGTGLGNNASYSGSDANTSLGVGVSDDGRYVAFESLASNLVNDDKNLRYDVFVRDMQNNITELASKLNPEFPEQRLGNSGGALRSVSGDGRYIAYTANQNEVLLGSDITPDEPIPFPQLGAYVFDRETQTTILGSTGMGDAPNCLHGTNPILSENGRFLAFASNCSLDPNFPAVPGPTPTDVFVRDLWLGATEQISLHYDRTQVSNGYSGTAIDGYSEFMKMSSDGRYIAFLSNSTDLVEGATISGGTNFFIHDRQDNITRLINRSIDGSQNISGV
ncbi:MAG: PD40 domain-containing protein, partial [Planctomycetales bacterium]|nr:PD40 domain-containing protein [Planctomycetales bacterium]